VYGFSHVHHYGTWADFAFDAEQRLEIILTLLQTGLGAMLLANMEFDWRDAAAIFVLWLAQFLVPHWREEVAVAYAAWMAILAIGFAIRAERVLAPRLFWESLQAGRRRAAKGEGGKGKG
jgi:hypothetical protein